MTGCLLLACLARKKNSAAERPVYLPAHYTYSREDNDTYEAYSKIPVRYTIYCQLQLVLSARTAWLTLVQQTIAVNDQHLLIFLNK